MQEDKARRLVELLIEKNITISTAESFTGGRIASALTAIPGCSRIFPGGIVSYCDRVKHQTLGVSEELLEQYSAVSEPVCKAMAEGAARVMGTELALSATGYAEEGGVVYLGLCYLGKTRVEKHHFPGGRREIQESAVERALEMALEAIE